MAGTCLLRRAAAVAGRVITVAAEVARGAPTTVHFWLPGMLSLSPLALLARPVLLHQTTPLLVAPRPSAPPAGL